MIGFWGAVAADGVEDEFDDGISEDGDDETDDGVEDGVFGVSNLLAIAARNDIADTAPDEHDDGKSANNSEGDASELSENTFRTDEVGRHTFGPGDFGTFLDGESHGFAGAERQAGADAGDDL